MTEPATVGAAIITRNDLPKLRELLAQLADLDQVVVVDTGSRDGTRAHVRKLGPPYELHEFQWRPRPAGHGPDDWGFAAARNESFRHLTTTHALWLDSDDIVVTLVDGRRIVSSPEALAIGLRGLAQKSPDVDVFLMDYLYQADEFGNPVSVVGKERLLKRSTGWSWRFPIHEIVFPQTKENKDVIAVKVQDIAVVHRPHDVESSLRRNSPMLRTWLRQIEKISSTADSDLARARFLVGRTFYGQNEFMKTARWMLTQYLGKHPHLSPEDKWEGWMEVARSLVGAGDVDGARHAALQAIGICPRFADAYILLADIKSQNGERPADILKLLEVAESCANESYGTHERTPLRLSFAAALIGADSKLRLGRPREALVLAERAVAMRPTDERARKVWSKAADASKAQLVESEAVEMASGLAPSAEFPRPIAPVFVVSSGRCGSTLVSNMLRLHPEILSLSEFLIMLSPGAFPGGGVSIYGSQFWALLSTPRKRMTLMYQKGIVFDEVLYRPGPDRRFTAETGVPPILLTALPHLTSDPESLYDEIQAFVLAQGPHPIGTHYLLLFEWLRRRFEKKLWVERSGSILVNIDELIAHFPGARFVHMYRDGRECAISMSHHSAFRLSMITSKMLESIGVDPFNTDDPPLAEVPDVLRPFMPETFDANAFWDYELPVEMLGTSWQETERKGITMLMQMPAGQVHQLRYEDLVAHPELELAKLTRFIGLAEPSEQWLRSAKALIKPKPQAWRRLPEAERARLEESTRFAMGMLYGSEVISSPEPEPSAELVGGS
jgi:putative sulfotransferase